MTRIVEYLNTTKECSEDIKKCVTITSDEFRKYTTEEYEPAISYCGLGTSPYNIINKDDLLVFSTDKSKYSITFEFKKKILITNYLIESTPNVRSPCHWAYPTKWSLLGLTDQQQWLTIDSEEGDYLNTRSKPISFELEHPDSFHTFKLNVESISLVQQRIWSALSRFEIYGIIQRDSSFCKSLISMKGLIYLFLLTQ